MVLETSGGCCESIIDGSESPGGCCEAICTLLQRNIDGFGSLWMLLRSHLHTVTKKYSLFWKLQEAAVNPLLMVWNLQEVAVKPFINFYTEISMVLESAGGHFYIEILMVLNFQ